MNPPWDNLQNGSIECLPNGNLVLRATFWENAGIPIVHEVSPDGTVLHTSQFTSIALIEPGATREMSTFDMTPQGNYVFGFNTRAGVPEPGTFTLALGTVAIWLVNSRPRRLRNNLPARTLSVYQEPIGM